MPYNFMEPILNRAPEESRLLRKTDPKKAKTYLELARVLLRRFASDTSGRAVEFLVDLVTNQTPGHLAPLPFYTTAGSLDTIQVGLSTGALYRVWGNDFKLEEETNRQKGAHCAQNQNSVVRKKTVLKKNLKVSTKRKKYPKCTVYAATPDHPSGFVSVQDAFNWPTVFLNRIAARLGPQWVCQRLAEWRWNFSSAFSGVGPICVSFSKAGKRLGTEAPSYKCHTAFYRKIAPTSDAMLIENVPEYPESLIKQELGPGYSVRSIVIDPRILGIPAARTRRYAIAWRHSKVKWRPEINLEDVVATDKKRFLSGEEMLASQILPINKQQADVCGAPVLQLDGLRNAAKAKAAGNSMSVPCVGLMLLVAALALEVS
ncbi:unnamed protein product [Durusdinium trenchii]|uniref:Uncharacterized protein n=1 Tax=Durusdinium trenchii TaxID=1381693 RepID=A0ABP0HKI0_9DINO